MKPLKKLDMLLIMTNPKNTLYEEKEIQDIIIKFYLTKRNLLI